MSTDRRSRVEKGFEIVFSFHFIDAFFFLKGLVVHTSRRHFFNNSWQPAHADRGAFFLFRAPLLIFGGQPSRCFGILERSLHNLVHVYLLLWLDKALVSVWVYLAADLAHPSCPL